MQDHTNFLLLLSGFMSALCLLFYCGYSTRFRRTEADMEQNNNQGGKPDLSTTDL